MGRRDNRSLSPKPAEPPVKKSRGEEQEEQEQEQEQEKQKEVKVEEVQTDKEQQKEVQTNKAEQEVQPAGEQKEKQTDEEVQEEEQKEVQKEDQTEELQGAEEQQEVQTDKEEKKEEQKEAQVPDVAVKDDVPERSNEKQKVSSLPLSDITSCPQHNLRVSSHVLLLQELKEAAESQAPPTQTRSGALSLPPYDPSVPVGESHTGAPVHTSSGLFKPVQTIWETS